MPWDPISRLIFPAPPPSYGIGSFPRELIFVPKDLVLNRNCPPEACIPCLFLKFPSARFLILYLHSNAEDIGRCYRFCHVLRVQFQVHVLAVEYPGYGICPGGPATAESVTQNALAAFRFVREVLEWPLDGIKVFGRSIGTGPAISLAVQYRVAGLILVAPFLSIKRLLQDALGVLSCFVEERFPSEKRMHLVQSPVLIIHGQKDTLVPCQHSAELFLRCRQRKTLICPEDMEHNTNLLLHRSYLLVPMLQFFSLPDYSFEDFRVPAWAFPCKGARHERPVNAEVLPEPTLPFPYQTTVCPEPALPFPTLVSAPKDAADLAPAEDIRWGPNAREFTVTSTGAPATTNNNPSMVSQKVPAAAAMDCPPEATCTANDNLPEASKVVVVELAAQESVPTETPEVDAMSLELALAAAAAAHAHGVVSEDTSAVEAPQSLPVSLLEEQSPVSGGRLVVSI